MDELDYYTTTIETLGRSQLLDIHGSTSLVTRMLMEKPDLMQCLLTIRKAV